MGWALEGTALSAVRGLPGADTTTYTHVMAFVYQQKRETCSIQLEMCNSLPIRVPRGKNGGCVCVCVTVSTECRTRIQFCCISPVNKPIATSIIITHSRFGAETLADTQRSPLAFSTSVPLMYPQSHCSNPIKYTLPPQYRWSLPMARTSYKKGRK